jgi:predicted metal-binding protein
MSSDQLGPSVLIKLEIPEEKQQKDLNLFKEKAVELGASMAEVIPADWVQVDERVRLKCSIPVCPHYGKSAFCPPHGPSLETLREAFSRYRSALLLALDVTPSEHFSERTVQRQSAVEWSRKCFEIVGRIETLAFGRGYYLAMGFAQASCKIALCRQEKCLLLEGGNCPYPLKARPSMEGVGIDVYGLVTRVGWDIYPIYRSVNPLQVPRALSVGIVLIH